MEKNEERVKVRNFQRQTSVFVSASGSVRERIDKRRLTLKGIALGFCCTRYSNHLLFKLKS